ncbi:MAG TPA: rod shape-determining protein [Verrucomicrobiae bacterium]|nr:rod shape-determining protein [Verrucomicrobiae bacterium]
MLTRRIGVDLGTRTTRVLVRGEGVVAEEPSLVAATDGDPRRAPAGRDALEWAVRHPAAPAGPEPLISPLAGGRVVDEVALEALVRHATGQGGGSPRFFRPDVVLTIASASSGRDRRLLLAAAARSGSRTCHLVDAPLAAALGADLPTDTTSGALVVHSGAAATEIAVVCQEGTVAQATQPLGGQELDRLLQERVAELTGIQVGRAGAERLKCELREGPQLGSGHRLTVTAGDPASDQPAAIATCAEADLWPALLPRMAQLADALVQLLEQLPSRLAAAHRRHGAVLTGGTAQLVGLDRWLAAHCGLPVAVAEDPERCCVLGTGRALDRLDASGRQLLYMR